MKNAYYHEFQVGFNWWMVAMAGFIVLAMILGARQYYYQPVKRNGRFTYRRRGRYNDRVYSLLAWVSGIAITVMLFVESLSGVVQWFDNRLGPNESAAWSVFMAPFAIILVGGMFGFLIEVVGVFASILRVKIERFYIRNLKAKARRIRREIARAKEERDRRDRQRAFETKVKKAPTVGWYEEASAAVRR